MAETEEYRPPELESYTVQAPLATRALAVESAAMPVREWKIALHGRNFFERAMMPIIRIGIIRVEKYEITPDGCGIVCYLQELPEEGAEISITYGPGMTTTLPQRFSSRQPGEIPAQPPATGNESEE